MKWISFFQLFLFDLDGLLVNTEELHFKAYQAMCSQRGFSLPWTFLEYCRYAHKDNKALSLAIYELFPLLQKQEPRWEVLYDEKKRQYFRFLEEGKVELMAGARALLTALQRKAIPHCVVTHSSRVIVEQLRSQIPILRDIPHWIVREDYSEPKPSGECYRKAIALHGKPGDLIIGFEDSLRGLTALVQTPAIPCLICSSSHPQMDEARLLRPFHYESLEEITVNNAPRA